MNGPIDRAEGESAGANPCAFSPGPRHAQKLARFYSKMFGAGTRVVDLGFGQGHFLGAARDRGLEPIGVDRDRVLVDRARAAGFDARCGEISELRALVPERLDGAIAAHLIEHLSPPEVRRLLKELAARVSPGGCLVIATPNFADWRVAGHLFWCDPTHIRPYPSEAVSQLIDPSEWRFEAQGFEPRPLTRHTLPTVLARLRYGRQYGTEGVWFRLRRVRAGSAEAGSVPEP